MVRTRGARPSIAQALMLGALHGPAELLPVSSSAHVSAVPWLLGWRHPELDGEAQKSFEVALHAGSAVAWLLSHGLERPANPRVAVPDPRRVLLAVLATAPAGVAGLAFERPVQERLGTPGSVAIGLLLGSAAMLLADRAPQTREADDARTADALWLGLAQACALVPGISRSAATLSAARLRRFSGRASWQLSTRMAAPVIAGATALKLVRMLREGEKAPPTGRLITGAGASLASTFLCTRMLRPLDHAWPLWPFVIYRCGLALGIVIERPRTSA